ncbi:MAG TPA: hypothetical protein PLD91_19725 [Spirochaetota bacterium]|nr:hypothetical protein [Spirochaetota bacterium]
MSVILKTREEIQAMAGGLLHHMNLYHDVLVESKTYQKIKSRAGEGCGENFEELFICWLMFRMWVANKVAYSVQYGDSVDIGEGLPELTPCLVDLSELSADLRNLNYNIYTNGGQYWLDHEWHDLFIKISDRIKEESEIVCAGVGR